MMLLKLSFRMVCMQKEHDAMLLLVTWLSSRNSHGPRMKSSSSTCWNLYNKHRTKDSNM